MSAAAAACVIGLVSEEKVKAQLQVTSSVDATALANSLLGDGISLVGTPTLVSGSSSAGFFSGGTSGNVGLGLDSGVLLTSGSVLNAPGPNINQRSSSIASGVGNASLNTLVSGSARTTDSTSLKFTFTSGNGDLFFHYVFASEEYDGFAHTGFNDVFGFFLDGKNIAVIPGTTAPVSVDTINGGTRLGGNADRPDLFNNNGHTRGTPSFNLGYDGFTKVLTASALGLSAGEHTLELAISDVGDMNFDSGVFIQKDAFSDVRLTPLSTVPDVGSTLPLLGLGILGLMGMRRRMLA